jgi:nucleoside-diphosphate-sugar epimerase
MERATILGIYDFIGYSLCRYLLDQGVEITGIHTEGNKKDHFTEEKRLEIGRNANFLEIGLQGWKAEQAEGILFVTLFESLQKRHYAEDILKGILSELENRQLKKLPTAVILPAYFAQENAELREQEARVNSLVSSRNSNLLTIYLPTIYGPWQPEECFFQQAMSQSSFVNKKIPEIGPREWTNDCLYIDDAVKMIKEMAESGHQGQYILSSGEKDKWFQCAEELLGRGAGVLRHKVAAPAIKESIKVRTVGQNEQISKGLSRQKEQFNRIQDSRV